MRITAHILSAILLAGAATAQSAPASQAVQPNPQPSKVQNGINAVKGALKNPFAPKAKQSQPAAQGPAKPQATASKPQTPAAGVKASAPAHPVGTQATAAAKPAKAAPVGTQAKTAAKPVKTAPVGTQAKTAAKPVKAAPVGTQAKTAAKPVKAAPRISARKVAPVKAAPAKITTAKTAPVKTAPTKAVADEAAVATQSAPKLPNPGKRDPFLSPLAAAAARGPVASCSTGKHCLPVDQLALKGIVQTKEGNIAMVENASKRSYYLHENDALFDGSVVKITGDSVTFRQDSSDVLGRPVSKEVVKKVSAPAV